MRMPWTGLGRISRPRTNPVVSTLSFRGLMWFASHPQQYRRARYSPFAEDIGQCVPGTHRTRIRLNVGITPNTSLGAQRESHIFFELGRSRWVLEALGLGSQPRDERTSCGARAGDFGQTGRAGGGGWRSATNSPPREQIVFIQMGGTKLPPCTRARVCEKTCDAAEVAVRRRHGSW